jgi:hypothetical protein
VNIEDQFARASAFGRYRAIPLHAEVICQGVEIGSDSVGSIIWRKTTTMNTPGSAVFPYPPNGIIEIDFESILPFKKPGKGRSPSRELKELSAFTEKEWKAWFSGHWDIRGAPKDPEKIPSQLVRKFGLRADTVLDSFMGRGTTAKATQTLGRRAVGHKILANFLRLAKGPKDGLLNESITLSVSDRIRLTACARVEAESGGPRIPVPNSPSAGTRPLPSLHTVTAISSGCSRMMRSGVSVSFLRLEITERTLALAYLQQRVLIERSFSG